MKILEIVEETLNAHKAEYGDASKSFENLAKLWSVILGQPVTAVQVNLCLIQLKVIRLMENPKHYDSMVDIVGYGALLPTLKKEGDDHDIR